MLANVIRFALAAVDGICTGAMPAQLAAVGLLDGDLVRRPASDDLPNDPATRRGSRLSVNDAVFVFGRRSLAIGARDDFLHERGRVGIAGFGLLYLYFTRRHWELNVGRRRK